MTFEGRQELGFQLDEEMDPLNASPSNREPDTLVVALDVPTYELARKIVSDLGETVNFYKIGLELLFDGGLDLAKELRDQGKLVFLDMKLSDIGNTVEKSVRNIAKLGVNYLTVHALDQKTLKSAVIGRGESPLKLLGVTVLTNLGIEDLREQGIRETPSELVLRRARLAYEANFDGVIASGFEARAIRAVTDDKFIIKTPGIRPQGSDVNDQSRVMTPRKAILEGAKYLVVGRPIVGAPDRKKAAEDIWQEIKSAQRELESQRNA